jgi:TolA-binding protein
MSKYLLILLSGISFLTAEVSVFGAGDLDSASPYGLTQSEKKILENKNEIEELSKTNTKLENKIGELESTIKTLQDLVRGVGQQNNEHRLKIANLIEDLKQNHLVTEISYKEIKENIDKTQSQVKQQEVETKMTLNEKIKESFAQVNEALIQQNNKLVEMEKGISRDFEEINEKFISMGKSIEKINKQYVTQKQLDFIVEDFNRFKESVLSEFEKLSKENDDFYDFNKHSNLEIFEEGKKNIELGKYTEAIKFFSYLITKHYRPATDNFYIGESYYFSGNYEQAIRYYKESVAIYDKSKFMPTLLLHSAVSLQKIGDIEQAKSFYSVLIAGYGDSVEGQKAIELLDEINKKEVANGN